MNFSVKKPKRQESNMYNIRNAISWIAAIAALLSASTALAQRHYDPKTIETIEGKVVSIEHTQVRGHGVHLTVQTAKESISVELGPAWYIDKQTPRIETNDTVTVTGSRVTTDGKPAIIAAQVKKGSEVLKLRDDNGIPAWSRRRR
jgi:hypothetical protein